MPRPHHGRAIPLAAGLSLSSLLALSMFAAAVHAGPHQIPEAPADIQALENPIDWDELDKRSKKRVARMYKSKCKKCHGADGDGKGSASGEIVIKPTALSAPGYMDERSDGQLFWITRDGSPDTEMKAYGPGSDTGLSEEEIWKLVSFMRENFTQ